MSAVSKKVMPVSSAAPTTASVSLRPIRMPKLLQPRPTTLTLSEPIVRVSIATPPWRPGSGRRFVAGSTVPAAPAWGPGRGARRQQMAEGSVDVTVGAPPDEVWTKVGDFGGLQEYFPGIDTFRLEGDDRIIGMFGMEIRERLLSRDDATRTISYSVIGGVPVESHRATISVEPDGAGSKITWAYAVTPDEMAPI